jgi:hypothetical protein
MTDLAEGQVLIQVVPVENDREILWGSNKVQHLAERLDDIKSAIATGTRTVADSLVNLPGAQGWQLTEVSGSFGLSLAAEAGVILTKASAETTFEVTVKFERRDTPTAQEE